MGRVCFNDRFRDELNANMFLSLQDAHILSEQNRKHDYYFAAKNEQLQKKLVST